MDAVTLPREIKDDGIPAGRVEAGDDRAEEDRDRSCHSRHARSLGIFGGVVTNLLDATTSDGDSRTFGFAWFEEAPLISEMRSAGFKRGYWRSWNAETIEP